MSQLHENIIQPRSLDFGLEKVFTDIFAVENVAHVFDTVAKLFTVIFLITCFIVVVANLLKVGQWKKYAQISALMSFIILVGLRSAPFLFVALPSFAHMNDWLNMLLAVVMQSIIYVCLIGVVIAFIFKLGFNLIEHPEFRKSYKMILGISCTLLVISPLIPLIII